MAGFYKCEVCGNIVGLIVNSGGLLVCCSSRMDELQANTVDASTEKHVPEITVNNNEVTVAVGSVLHPMEEAHHISYIYLETEQGGQRKALRVGQKPEAVFAIVGGDKVRAAYEYCNLHGL